MEPELRGLYAITPWPLAEQQVLQLAEQALRGGAAVLQLRDKSDDAPRRLRLARALREACQRHRALFIVNDDLALAQAVGADGVHLGRDDTDLAQARAQAPELIIGVSCYASLERAERAQALGADYVAFGRFFASRSKPEASPAPLEVLRQARERLFLPVVAIGGITLDNAPRLLAAGAQALAVIDGLFGQVDVEASARRFAGLFARGDILAPFQID